MHAFMLQDVAGKMLGMILSIGQTVDRERTREYYAGSDITESIYCTYT